MSQKNTTDNTESKAMPTVAVRISPEAKAAMDKMAKLHDRKPSYFIRKAIEEFALKGDSANVKTAA